ncbi:MAG: bifunctional riboflavin kinase/FAD synthetase [Anaerolineaceae bacterium]
MTVIFDFQQQKLETSWVTVGSYDGVHRGHQELIRHLVNDAHKDNSPAVVVTFHPHPAIYFGRATAGYTLTSPQEREKILKDLGVDHVITLQFTAALANLTAQNFMQLLKQNINLTHLLIGFNFALGRDRMGDLDSLQQFGKYLGYKVDVIHPVKVDGEVVSSSQIRNLLQEGQLKRANAMLGRPYSLEGKVVQGEHRGNRLGFPTANLDIPSERLLPTRGVYACRALVRDKAYLAVTNIGIRPTFANPLLTPRVEPHLLDLNEDLYGEDLKIELIEYLRPEQTFDSPADLIAQVQRDIQETREMSRDGE